MRQDLLYLKKLFSRPFHAVRVGGQTNRNYIVTFREPFNKFRARKFFVRLPWENAVLNRSIEGENIVRLSHNKKLKSILPRYYSYILKKKNILDPKDKEVFNVPDGTMVTEYLEGREFTFQDFLKSGSRQRLARMFYTFHTSGVQFSNSYSVFRDEIRKYRKKTPRSWWERFFDEKTKHNLIFLEREAEQKLPSLKKGVPTHNDLLFQNFLLGKDKKLYLLDFEYAGMNKKGGILYDFGFFFADNLFRKPPITKKLFEGFLDIVDQVYKKKLNHQQIYWAAVAALLMQVWWGILRYFNVSPKEKPYFREYVTMRIQGISSLSQQLQSKT